MSDDEFYAACAQILNTQHEGTKFPFAYRTRWNNRTAGRGRYPGFGTIQKFGSTVRVNLHTPKVLSRAYSSPEAAIAALQELIAS